MNKSWQYSNSLRFLITILLLLGIFFRFFNLDYKVYWHDEVYTTMRASGFTRGEIDREIFQNRIIPAQSLQKFQRIKAKSTAADTIKSLAIEDPQHPPLYYLMSRFWMQVFGSSLTASRFLPALLSLLALPLMYGLAWELFGFRLAALFATVFLALSPFDVLFAQTTRQYSLLTVTAIGSSFFLLRAMRLQTWRTWGFYTLINAIGLYNHPFFGLTLIGHLSFVICHWFFERKQAATSERENYTISLKPYLQLFLSLAITLILFAPWLIILKTNYQRMQDTTNWARVSVDFLYLVKLWILSFTSIFLDLDFGFDSVWTYVLRGLVVAIIVAALYTVCRKTNRKTWLFIITSILVPFLVLLVPDLLFGGKRSAVSRYLISCYPGIQLAVAYFLATKIVDGKKLWRGVFALLVTGSIASCTLSAFYDTWWCKDLSYFNAEVAKRINASSSPLVLSDIGDDFTNTGDLISLSYRLDKDVKLLLVSQSPNLKLLQGKSNVFVFRPSGKVWEAFKREKKQLEQVFPAGKLWRVRQNAAK